MMVECGVAAGHKSDRWPSSRHLMHFAQSKVLASDPATLGEGGSRNTGPAGPADLGTGVWRLFSGLHPVHRAE